MKTKKIGLTEKQKGFLKKSAITAGVVFMTGSAFYIFNRSELGHHAKEWVIRALQKSMITKNDRLCNISICGLKPYFMEDDLVKAVDAAFSVLKPIADEYNKR